METEAQQEEEEEKNSFYSSYKEAVQGEGREGVEDPLREVKFVFLSLLGTKTFPTDSKLQIRVQNLRISILEVQIIRVIYKHSIMKYQIMTILN